MSQIQVDNIYNKEATGSPSFPLGANVTGVVTATTFNGGAEITSGTINATSVTAASGTFNGPVTIGGTLTYEDVTNIDSVGVITARKGIKVLAGGIDAVGVVTAGNGVNITAGGINVTAGDVDITNGSLGVGLNNPGLKLHIQDGALPSAPAPNGNCDMVLEGTTNTGIQFLSGNQTQLRFGDADSTAAGSIIYKHTEDNFRLNFSNSGYLSLNDGGGENLRFTPNNEIGIAGANYGTSGQVLTSGGSGAPVQWADAGGAVELVQSVNQTSGATYLEVTGITDTCVKHVIVLNDITYGATKAANQGQIRAQVYLAGSYNNWLTSNSEYDSRTVWQEWNTGVSQGWGNSLDHFRITADTDAYITAGDLTIYPNGFGAGTGSASDKLMVGSMMLSNNGHVDGYFRMDAYYARQNPITRIRFFDGNGRNIWGRADLYRYNR